MFGDNDYVVGAAAEVLTEQALTNFYGAPLKRVTVEHEGRRVETIALVPLK